MPRALSTAAVAAVLLLAGCGNDEPEAGPTESSPPASTAASPASPSSTDSSRSATPAPPPSASTAPTPQPTRPPKVRQRDVLAISVDGLNVRALDGLPQTGGFGRLTSQGAWTDNARTELELTVTLPNHTGMLTGRRIDAARGGHGVTWNDDLPNRTVPGPDGDGVASVFDVVHDSGGTSALFAGKDKFAIYERSWPDSIDEFELDEDAGALVDDTMADLTGAQRRFTFLHLRLPDDAGHASGWMSEEYLSAVADTDALVGEVLDAVEASPRLSRRLIVILTADHGGPPGEKSHSDAGDPDDFQIPFFIWGRGIKPADLYAINPDYADPGTGRPAYDGTQPVRNGDLANLSLDILGLGPVPGSELDAGQDLDWR